MQVNPGSIPGLGSSPGEGKGYPLQYSGLENSMDCIVHGVTKSQTQPSSFCFSPYSRLQIKIVKILLLLWFWVSTRGENYSIRWFLWSLKSRALQLLAKLHFLILTFRNLLGLHISFKCVIILAVSRVILTLVSPSSPSSHQVRSHCGFPTTYPCIVFCLHFLCCSVVHLCTFSCHGVSLGHNLVLEFLDSAFHYFLPHQTYLPKYRSDGATTWLLWIPVT